MNNELKIGVASVDITPAEKIKLEGFLLARYSTGIKDPLFAKAMVLQKKDVKLAIICCDLLHLGNKFIKKVLNEIERRTGIFGNNIMVCCSHTHSAPQVENNPLVEKEKKYLEFLFNKLLEVVDNANDKLIDAKVAVVKAKFKDPIYWNSRINFLQLSNLYKDFTISKEYNPDFKEVITTGPIDPEVGIIFFKDIMKNNILATFYNFSCHASANNWNCFEISADYPGVTSKIIEDNIGGLAFYTRGSGANVHPKAEGHTEELGQKLGKIILEQYKKANFVYPNVLKSVKEEIVLQLRDLDSKQINEVNFMCDKIFIEPTWSGNYCSEKFKNYFKKSYYSFEKLKEKKDKITTIIQAVRIGNAVLVTVPGEQFVEYGLRIKSDSYFKNTFLVDLANDSIGYIPTKNAYKEGGYQTWTGPCIISPEAGELLVQRLIRLTELLKTDTI